MPGIYIDFLKNCTFRISIYVNSIQKFWQKNINSRAIPGMSPHTSPHCFRSGWGRTLLSASPDIFPWGRSLKRETRLKLWSESLVIIKTFGWEMKLLANKFVWKLAKWWDPMFNDLLVVQDLSGEEKKPGAVSKSPKQRMDNNNIISQLTGAKVSRMSQVYSQAVSHGGSLMCSKLYF